MKAAGPSPATRTAKSRSTTRRQHPRQHPAPQAPPTHPHPRRHRDHPRPRTRDPTPTTRLRRVVVSDPRECARQHAQIGRSAHVEQVSVRPEHQGLGIGRALIDQVRVWAARAARHPRDRDRARPRPRHESVHATRSRQRPVSYALAVRSGFDEHAASSARATAGARRAGSAAAVTRTAGAVAMRNRAPLATA
jgi:Acetyltransferase (GNAT) family